ncbi:MAG: glycosyltransferase family 4 protein, partial [bacterium]
MRIAIDYNSALPVRVGIGRYTHNLVKSIAMLDRSSEYFLFSFFFRGRRQKLADVQIPSAPNFSLRSAPIPVRITRFFSYRLNLPIELFIGNFDLVHFPDPLPFRGRRAKVVVTIHDIVFAIMPHLYMDEQRAILEEHMEKMVKRVDAMIAVSGTTRNDLLRTYGVEEGRVHVVEHGVEESFKPITASDPLEEIRRKYKLPEKFVLAVGTLEPRKNHLRLIQAFRLMCEKHAGEHSLVICGKKGWMYEEIFSAAASPGLRGKVFFIGYVPDEDLPSLYNLANVVAYPSLYEGFGLPVVEAMACGRPVLTSDRGTMA